MVELDGWLLLGSVAETDEEKIRVGGSESASDDGLFDFDSIGVD